VNSRCGLLLDQELTSPTPLNVGVELPEGVDMFEATVHVSRTWQPSARPPGDTRQLGAAVVSDWLRTGPEAREQARFVGLNRCDS